MRKILNAAMLASFGSILFATTALADWNYSGPPSVPNAFIQTNNMSLELQCDRIRFSPAGYDSSQDIERKQGLSIRFMSNGSTEVGAFQAGASNASIGIVDNYPVEVVFSDAADYDFVLDQIAATGILNLAMIDQDVTYGIFGLEGSAAAIRSLRAECGGTRQISTTMEAPEGVVYCGGGAIKRQIEYIILDNPSDQWDARVTVNGERRRAMTAYSYFGNAEEPKDFLVALLAEEGAEFLIFRNGNKNWLEFGDYQYNQCN
jgi:hypothetical protein